MTREESEVIEVKKDKLWAKIKLQEELNSWEGVEGGLDEEGINYILNIIGQLDEPEILSQKWIDENVEYGYFDRIDGSRGFSSATEFVRPEKLKNLLVPKQEELEVKIQELIESYKQVGDAFSELENVWISGFIKDLKNLVEKEQKYYVLDSEHIPLLERANNRTRKTKTALPIHEDGRNNSKFELTEQEIKEYDERYWPFAVEVRDE